MTETEIKGGFSTITYQSDGPVAIVTMNRPDKHNAISLQMLHELRDAILQSDSDNTVNIILLQAAGHKSFSAGIDLAAGILDQPDKITDSMRNSLVPLLESMELCSKPIIASVEGAAIGLGVSLALQCDLLAISERASLSLAFNKLGLIADGGINWQLPIKVGYNRAFQMVLEAEILDAQTCLGLGLANKVMSAENMQKEVLEWARELAQRSSLAQAYTKRLMRNTIAGCNLLDTVNREAELQATCADSDYFKDIYNGILNR